MLRTIINEIYFYKGTDLIKNVLMVLNILKT